MVTIPHVAHLFWCRTHVPLAAVWSEVTVELPGDLPPALGQMLAKRQEPLVGIGPPYLDLEFCHLRQFEKMSPGP
jgi:hypothetical protein